MGCSGSKAEDLPLVVRCRERRDLIRAAANHRYALAAAHVSYFRSLKDVGDALRKFVDEELVTASHSSASSSSSFSSPSLTLPRNSKQKHDNADESSLHLHDDEEDEESHLHLSDSSSEDVDSEDYAHHFHNHHHHGHDSEDDTHQHHKHQNQKHHGGHVPKGKKGFDDEVSHLHSEETPSHYHRAGFNEYAKGFGDGFGNEGESSSHYPRDSFNGYGNGFGDGLGNDPHSNPYPHAYPPYPPPHSYGEPYMDPWDPRGVLPAAQPWYYSSNTNMYYMKKAAPAIHRVVQEPPAEPSYGYSDSYWNPAAGYGGNYGYVPMGTRNNEGVKVNQQKEAPPPPSPKASGWDFFNPFDGLENGYAGYYSSGRYGNGSNFSSPDSTEVREREGIPDLEEETESEAYKEVPKGNKMKVEAKKSSGDSSSRSRALPVHQNVEGSSRRVPLHKNEGKRKQVPMGRSESSSKSVSLSSSEESEKPSVPPQYNGDNAKPSMASQYGEKSVKPSVSPLRGEGTSWVDESPSRKAGGSISLSDEKSSSENIVLESVDEGNVKKKRVSFEVEEASKEDGESSKLSSVTLLSPRGTRDLREVVAEIRDEFETAASYGKEVAVMLEVGKLPYQPTFFKEILSRILYPISPSLSSRDPSMQAAKLASRTMKLAKSYFDDVGKDVNSKACNLSSTMDKLYAWEKKLNKEVKDEEKLLIMYEKQCKKLKALDEEGAESGKIDAARASIRRLLTKLDVSVKAIDAISIRIHKLRDEELQPQVAELIHGLIRMWKAMLRCHKKQFQAVMESKMHGPVPYSPGHLGAPLVFVICNDWHQAMEAISEARVANAMNTFARRGGPSED